MVTETIGRVDTTDLEDKGPPFGPDGISWVPDYRRGPSRTVRDTNPSTEIGQKCFQDGSNIYQITC